MKKSISVLKKEIYQKSHHEFTQLLNVYGNKNDVINLKDINFDLTLPINAAIIFLEVLNEMKKGNFIKITPISNQVSTQKAAEIIGCSRPHLIKILEEGKINHYKVGKHRRLLLEDVMEYQKEMKLEQKQKLIQMMELDEEIGLYESKE